MKLPANWKTSLTGIGAAITAALTTLAALPYTLGDVATVIPPNWKAFIFKWGLVATIVLKVWNAFVQKDREVTGGTKAQDADKNVATPQPAVPPPPQPAFANRMPNFIKKAPLIALLCALPLATYAGPPDTTQLVQDEVVNILTARAFEASVYGTFAPKLVGSGRYGAGLSLSHPIGQYGFVGLRFDVLGQAYTAGTFGGGLKAPFTLWGHNITPYAGTGLKSVLQGDRDSTGTVSASVYTGFDAQLYLNKSKTVEVGVKAELEYDSAHAGIQIFHGGPYAAIKF